MSLAFSLLSWLRRHDVPSPRYVAPATRSLRECRRFRPETEQLEEQLPPGSILTGGLGGEPIGGLGLPSDGPGTVVGGANPTLFGVGIAASAEGSSQGSTDEAESGSRALGGPDLFDPRPPVPLPPPGGEDPGSPAPTPPSGSPNSQTPGATPPPTGVAADPGIPAADIYAMLGTPAPGPKRRRPKRQPPRKKPHRPRRRISFPPPAAQPIDFIPTPSPTTPVADTPIASPPIDAPTYFAINGLADSNGSLPSYGLTNDATPTLVGVGTPGEHFRLQVDGQANAEGTVRSDGTWELTLTGALGDGEHAVRAVGMRNGQPTASQSVDFPVRVDTEAPTVTVNAPEFSTTTLPILTARVEDTGSPGFATAVEVDADRNADGDFEDDGERAAFVGLAGLGESSLNAVAEIPEGTYSLRARARDWAGNEGISPVVSMQVDPNAGYISSQPLLALASQWPMSSVDAPAAPTDAGEPTAASPREQLREQFWYLRFDEQERVGVNVRVTLTKYLDGLKQDLEALGMEVMQTAPAQGLVIGYLPVEKITQLPTLEHFSTVTPLWKPIVRAGVIQSQGDTTLKADMFRGTYSVDGTGVTVGVMSDSVDQVDSNADGIRGIRESQRTGDLPVQGVRVLTEDTSMGVTDEGRAMLEIVHDVAPGADLAYHTASLNPQNFADGIRSLQAIAGAKVIVDDIGYPNSPFFNDGVIAQAVDDVVAQGATYFSAAGNDGNKTWGDTWRGVSTTAAGVNGIFHDLDPGEGVDVLQEFTLAANAVLLLPFQWDDAYLEGGTNQPGYQVETDLEVRITNATGTQTFAIINTANANTDEAFEFIGFMNTGTGTTNFALSYRLNSGPAPTAIRWISAGASANPQVQNQGNAPAIFGQPAARSAVAVGAVWALQSNQPENFTSKGGNMPFYFDRQGTRLAQPELRRKPETSAPDGANTSFFGMDVPQDADTRPNFFGTSAAAPHAAAAAALLLQQTPELTPRTLVRALERTAIDIAPPGIDDLTGVGLIQLDTRNVSTPVGSDRYELNETSDQPTQQGTLPKGVELFYGDLTIARHANNLPDYDWFEWRPAQAGSVRAVLVTDGSGDLEITWWTVDAGGFLQELARDTTLDVFTRVATTHVTAGQRLLLQVKARNVALGQFDQGGYDLALLLT